MIFKNYLIDILCLLHFLVITFPICSPHKHLLSRVELHLHLDGSVRPPTISELAIAKKVNLTAHNSVKEITTLLTVKPNDPHTLGYFLSRLALYVKPLITGDLVAIERIAYELAQDEASQGVAYFEARFSPHLLVSSTSGTTLGEVINAVALGLARGEADFGVKSRMILCTIKGKSGWAKEILSLAISFKDKGVVGIDIAGNETAGYSAEEIHLFTAAKRLGIHRTVHAGEAGPASNVAFAVENLFAERIGHGYSVLQDLAIYQMIQKRRIHFETCPTSSYCTGAVKEEDHQHPIVQFNQDGVSFSISRDDSTVTNTTLEDEYGLVKGRKMFLKEVDIGRSNLEAAKASFLSKKEKAELVKIIKERWRL